jgi:hypothetical protein
LGQVVVGRFAPHHAFLLTEQLTHLDFLEQAMAGVSAEIEQRLAAEWEAIALLDTIPGMRGAHRRSVARRARRRSEPLPPCGALGLVGGEVSWHCGRAVAGG